MTSTTNEQRTSEEPLGQVHSFLSLVFALRHQVSKYGYLRGAVRHAKRQAVRWEDIVRASKRKGTEEYLARRASTDSGVRYFPGVGFWYKAGGVTGPRSLYVVGAVVQHYLQIFLRLLLFLVMLPLLGVMGVLYGIEGLVELDPTLAGGSLLLAALCLGAVYWLRTADVESDATAT